MNPKRLATAFMIALAVSALCTWLLGRRIGTQAAARVVEIHYVAPSKSLQVGEILKLESLKLVSWPANNPIPGAYLKPEDLVGRGVLYPIDVEQPITDRVLAAPGAGLGLSTRIPNGMRAIALRSDEIMGVAGFIYPGSHLDVLVTARTDKSPDPVTFIVLQDAEVLAVGQKSQPDPDGKPATATVVTLLLTPLDAERAVMASTQGTFHFVLRSGSDKTRVTEMPITLAHVSGDWTPATPATVRRFTPRAIVASSRIMVETVAGDKQSVDAFSGGR